MDKILEGLTKPIDPLEWATNFSHGIESDTGENSRQYLQQRLFMSFKEFSESLMDPTDNPSLSIRPTDSQKRKFLLKDLDKNEGFIVLTHTGEVITTPGQKTEDDEDGNGTPLDGRTKA